LIPKSKLPTPLSSCLHYLAQNMLSFSEEELNGVFQACVNLLSVAKGRPSEKSSLIGPETGGRLLREILAVVDEKLCNAELSARSMAQHFTISEGYVHKLFARCGIRFSHYVTRARLERVHADLMNASLERTTIAAVAYRWGFNDLSTFNRAFRNMYGCSPSQLQQSEGPRQAARQILLTRAGIVS